jgi:hypothetical protein
MGRTLDEALQHAMEAAGEWAQAVSLPRPRLPEALRDDSCVKAALADGDGGSRSVANPVGANISHHSRHAGSDRRGSGAHVCGVDVQLTRPRSEPPIARQAIEITGATEAPVFVTDVRKALAQGPRREA